MSRIELEYIPIRIVNTVTGEVFDFLRCWSVRKAKQAAQGGYKRIKFTDLRIYRNVKNPFFLREGSRE